MNRDTFYYRCYLHKFKIKSYEPNEQNCNIIQSESKLWMCPFKYSVDKIIKIKLNESVKEMKVNP